MIRVSVHLVIVIFLVFPTAPALLAQEAPGRVVRYEVSASWLGLTPSGNVLTNSNQVDFVSDLGIDRMQSQAGFSFFMQPWKRGGMFVEVIPYRFSGENTITRSFRFGGVTYPVNESVSAKATLNYISTGYEHAIVTRPRLNVGLLAGVAYIGVRAHASGPTVGSADVNRDVPFPLTGFVARYSPAAQSHFSIRGEIRGMTFGSYGRYIDGSGALGFNMSRHMTLEAGYRVVDGEGHHKTRGAELNFRGPTITLRVHDKWCERC
jgi:hypothetical protein